jgi:uncharacterized protein YijF (DUF1287 family)
MLRLLAIIVVLAPTAVSAAGQPSPTTAKILDSAVAQVGVTLTYDAAYSSIPFPGGDVPMERGVCTDVVVRAYRGVGIDLQLLINQDMRKAFSVYPRNWGLSKPDPNIDHRRVPNLMTFFSRHGTSLPITNNGDDYKPGDIVTWKLPDGRPHIGLVSNKISASRNPMIVHNIGAGAQLEDMLFTFTVTGHYRYPADNR